MRVSLLTTTNSHLAGGLYNSVRCLGLAMLHSGIDVNIVSYNDEYSSKDIYAYDNIPMEIYHQSKFPLLSRLGYSSDLHRLLGKIKPDVIHSQGLWMYNSKAALDYRRKYNRSISLVAPRGMLDSWAIKQSKLKKRIVGAWFEYEHLKQCDCIHALCQSEYESIREYGLKSPVAIIPNGISLPEPFIKPKKTGKNLLFIGRIHPKKGLDLLIEAISIIKQRNAMALSNWTIRIAGWNQLNHQENLQKKVDELKVQDIISFIGPVLGDKKREELINADAFILPSFSEGLPMSILEAWSYKLPVIMTKYCNIPDGFSQNAAVEIDVNAEDIANKLIHFFEKSDEERILIGMNGYNLTKSKFTWNAIAKETEWLYQWLLGKGSKPDYVYE